MSAVRAHNARLLRRLVLVPSPELVESFDDATPTELVEAMLDATPSAANPPQLHGESDFWSATEWWLTRMSQPAAGFNERMIWFWHGHLTSGLDKSGPAMMLGQLGLLRRGARGSFRELLRAITLDPAMLYWLDGSGSDVSAPNENYARELMELFALGRNSHAYAESDVRSGAKALAGYWVDEDGGNSDNGFPVEFDVEAALTRPVQFLGRPARDVDDVIDIICDRAECAHHVAAAVHQHFIGGPLHTALHDQLAEAFAMSALDIDVLVRLTLADPTFLDGPPRRPRSALEWYLALQELVGEPLDMWPLESMGQAPLNPPNVAGWPGAERWASAGLTLTKGQIALDNTWDTDTLDRADPVTDVLRRAALYEVSSATRAALDELAASAGGRREQASLLHAAVAMCPEFSLC